MTREKGTTSEEGLVAVTVRIPRSLQKTARKAAIDREIMFQTAVKEALELWLAQKTSKP